MTSPSEEGRETSRNVFEHYADPEPDRPEEPEGPKACPECGSRRGYSRIGKYRVQCDHCHSLLKNEEVDMQPSNEETTR